MISDFVGEEVLAGLATGIVPLFKRQDKVVDWGKSANAVINLAIGLVLAETIANLRKNRDIPLVLCLCPQLLWLRR